MAGELRRELASRWRDMFGRLRDGEDLPPAVRLRAEGMMESAVLVGEATAEQLQQAMDEAYDAVHGHGLVEDFGADWREFYPFPQIPGVMQRAPVWPSTRD